MLNLHGWGRALFGDTTSLAAFRALDMPVLLMQGSETTPSSRAVSVHCSHGRCHGSGR